ncbi:MAG: nucleoside diphosphate kinase regulator [Desulfitobacteriaceae bacterium]|nr:nucleoside diphosphate kinase regulator [Desulfitobacteriaceae bacterium]MDD4752882.1 nucleoside diphosphate kinase regulator [Desulfitobacteriaceae bacterium]
MPRMIYISESDKGKLQKLIIKEKEYNSRNKKYLKNLEQELNRARTVSPQEIPHDAITMNSTVLLSDLESGEEMTYTLVYPDEADLTKDRISVLAPVGTAILGYREGDIVDWEIPNGVVRLKVEKIIYQPEAAGQFDL